MKKSFLLYHNQDYIFDELSDEKAGQLIKYIFEYSVSGKKPEIECPATRMGFRTLQTSLDMNVEKYKNVCKRNKANGLKGGRPKNPEEPKKPSGLSGLPKKPKKPDIDTIVDIEKKEPLSTTVDRIVKYLNKKTGSHFKPTTQKTINSVRTRMNEGFTTIDFKKVIDTKTKAWINDEKMMEFLRPDTLFGPKFESYLNSSKSNPNMPPTQSGVGSVDSRMYKEYVPDKPENPVKITKEMIVNLRKTIG